MIPHNKPNFNNQESNTVAAIVLSGKLTPGAWTYKLEAEWCKLTGAESAAMVKSGTAALRLSLRALDVERDDYVLVPRERCVCYDNVIEGLEAELSEKRYSGTTAQIVVHLFGEYHRTALVEDEPVIEDMSHGIFQQTADVAVASFAPTKLVGSCSGGIVSGSKELIDKVKDLRDYADKTPNARENDTPNEIEAALAYLKLKRLPATMDDRKIAIEYYQSSLGANTHSGFYRFCVKVDNAEEVSKQMQAKGVCAEIPTWIHDNHTLSLPLFEGITTDEQNEVIRVYREVTGSV